MGCKSAPTLYDRALFYGAVLALAGVALLLGLTGCSKRETTLTTGAVLSRYTLPGARGSESYAVVRSDALPGLYAAFRDVLAKQGLVRWDSRFDCNAFATLYVGVAQARFAAAAWHSRTDAQALALAEVWYHRDAGGHHAIVQAITEHGPVFIEPQTGEAITLSEQEQRSITLRKW
jgi:hypothetical protein